MLRIASASLLLLAAGLAAAQVQPGADSAAPGPRNQKIQRIVQQDSLNRIEEVRHGGQTESITVQPVGDLPPYEVAPAHLSRSRPADERNGLSGAGGQRYWNVFKF